MITESSSRAEPDRLDAIGLKAWARFRPEAACFAVVAGVYLLHLFLSGYDRFYYDSSVYWQLGDRFEENGHFSLLAYSDEGYYPRGYALPLWNRGLHELASVLGIGDVTIIKVFGALLAATLGVLVLPRLARALLPGAAVDWWGVLALNGLVFLYWRDHFDFPLSDFPALTLACAGVLAALRGSLVGYAAAGLFLGLAANIRPAYLPAFVLLLVVLALARTGPADRARRTRALALVVVCAFVAVLPQMLINHRHDGSWSPGVDGQQDISMLQLSDGMKAQKYETYVGPATGYPQPQVFYDDPSTQHVLAEEHVSATQVVFGQPETITSYGQYARIVVHHPAKMAGAYLRRLFNGLDVRYPTPYIRNLGNTSIVLSLLEYTLLFVALATLLLPDARRALGKAKWAWVVVLVSPCITSIPGAVEPRFFLPVQMVVYIFVCFAPAATRRSLLRGGTARRVGLAVCFVAFVLVCLSLSSSTLAELEHPGQTLGLGAGARLVSPV